MTWVWFILTIFWFLMWLMEWWVGRRRRGSLHGILTGPGGPRCACGRFWVPRDFHAVWDDFGRHDPVCCQPESEWLR